MTFAIDQVLTIEYTECGCNLPACLVLSHWLRSERVGREKEKRKWREDEGRGEERERGGKREREGGNRGGQRREKGGMREGERVK